MEIEIQNISDRLGDLELFADCTKDELRKIRSSMTLVRADQGTVLAREGSAAHEFVLVAEGQLSLTRTGEGAVPGATEVGRGGFLGAVELLTGTPHGATAVAETDLLVYASSVAEFRDIVTLAPSVERKIWQLVERQAWRTLRAAPAAAGRADADVTVAA